MPGHPSELPSSRSSEAASNSTPPPPNYIAPPPPQHPASSSGSNQTRNIIIGAISTIVASTIIYYLTQYQNRNKSDSADSLLVKKEATSNAWNSYVTIDNLYYKNILLLANDKRFSNKLDNFKTELFNEAEKFIKDAEAISKKKNIDEAFVTLVSRRLEREKEIKEYSSGIFRKIDSVKNSGQSVAEQRPALAGLIEDYEDYLKEMEHRAANELEDLSNILSERYGKQLFNLNDFLFYTDYKKTMAVLKTDTTGNTPVEFAKNINPKSLIGNWNDNNNKLILMNNNKMNYSLVVGEKDTGTWKIENDQLRLDAVNLDTKDKSTWFFNLSKITPNSFTMTLWEKPFDTYNLVRVK